MNRWSTDTRLVFLLIANILVLIAGCFIDGNSIMYIFVPIFMPIATALGVDLYHLGVVLVMNVAIGQVTPPVGCNLFVACGIGGAFRSRTSSGRLCLISSPLPLRC